jgi:DNA-binding SARP family transcriptional activator
MIRIHALGRFQVEVDGQPLVFGRKLPHKVLQLLQTLLCDRRYGLGRQTLCEILWPNDALWTAAGTLATTLHRLRRMLRCHDAISADTGRVRLDPQHVWVDLWEFEQAVEASHDLPSVFNAFELYQGTFAAGSDQPLVAELRERLRRKFLRTTLDLCELYERAGEADVAADFYQDALEREPVAEALHRGLITCLTRTGSTAEAAAAYARYGSLFPRKPGALSDGALLSYRERGVAGERGVSAEATSEA